MFKLLLLLLPCLHLLSDTYYYHHGEKVYLKPQKSAPSRQIDESLLHVKDSYDHTFSIKNSVIFQRKEGISLELLDKLFHLKRVKPLGKDLFTCNTQSANDAITLANRLYESGYVKFAMPNIQQRRIRR